MPAADWAKTERALGTALPADYKQLVTPPPSASTSARRRRLTWAGVAALGVLAVAVHLGLRVRCSQGCAGRAGFGAVLAAVVKITALTVFGRRVHGRSRGKAG